MIKKENRFTTRNFEFLRRKMKGRRIGDFLFLYGDGRGQTRFAVVISKKVEKLAVNRNKFRRQVYEFFRKEGLLKCNEFNTICLYKGKKIPKNTAEILPQIQKYINFIERKNSDNKINSFPLNNPQGAPSGVTI